MGEEAAPGAQKALKALHYLSPFTVAFIFLLASGVGACLLQKSTKYAPYKKSRLAAVWIIFTIITTFMAEIAINIFRALANQGWFAPQHEMMYCLASIFIWVCLTLSFLGNDPPAWQPHLTAWASAFILNIVVQFLSAANPLKHDNLAPAELALGTVRLLLLLSLTSVGAYTIVHALWAKPAATDEENQPLLTAAGDSEQPNTATATQYGAIFADGAADTSDSSASKDKNDEDEDEDKDDDKEIKEQQRKRMEESGSYWAYIKSFKVFLPYLWPAGNRKAQLWFGVIIFYLTVDRFTTVLAPRQLGIVVTKLSKAQGTSQWPWEDILLWMFYRWITSSGALSSIYSMADTRVDQFMQRSLLEAAFKHIMGLSLDFHSGKTSSEVIQAVYNAQSMSNILKMMFFDLAPHAIDMVVAVIYISSVFDMYAAFVTLVITVSYFWFSARLTSWTRDLRRASSKKHRERSTRLYEPISNWLTVSYFNRKEYEQKRLAKTIDETIAKDIRYDDMYTLVHAARSLTMTIGLLSVSLLAAWRVSQGISDVGSFVNLVTYWATFVSPLSYLSYLYNRLFSMLIDAERLLQIFQTKAAVDDAADAKTLEITEGEVAFQDVDFSYDPRKETLKDITFTAAPATTVALCGETGSGKSTLLKLLFRFYDVKNGSIRIDGQDLRDISISSLRKYMGVVPQDPILFNESIMSNIKYARLEATDEEVHEACKAAAIHDKIMTFPDGYKSKVGERGVKLSGGELQRVAIARVLLMNPRIVLLDEATSAVDSTTEGLIQEAFKRLGAGRTVFVVAHRLSTICDADMILCLDNGKIIERGTHHELLELNGKYAELWTKQTSANKAATPESKSPDDTAVGSPETNPKEDLLIELDAEQVTPAVEEDTIDDLIPLQLDGPQDGKPQDANKEVSSKVKALQARLESQGPATKPKAEEGEGSEQSTAKKSD